MNTDTAANMEGVQEGDHMAEEKISQAKQITKSSLLDSFSTLESNKENCRVTAGIALLRCLHQKQRESENEVSCAEVNYSLKRLIRGLATSNTSKRAGFFSVLVEIFKLFPSISLQDVFSLNENDLKLGHKSSKKEITEVCSAQTLLFGALIHSNFIFKETKSAQVDIISKLIAVGQKKKILFPCVCSFLIDFIQKIDEEHFREVLWPLLKPELNISWEKHSLDSLYLLLLARKLFPEVVKKKFLVQTLGSKDVFSKECISPCCKLLLNSSIVENHPVYEMIYHLACSSNSTILFWEALVKENEQQPSQQKEQALFTFIEFLLQHMPNKAQIPELLCNNFMGIIIKTFQMKKIKVKLAQRAKELFTKMSNLLTSSEMQDEVRISFIQRILFYPGNLMFDKLAGTRILVELSSCMKGEAVEKIGKILRDVVSARKPKIKNAQGETCLWTKWERSYAAQVFIRLLSLPVMEENIKWKLKQLKFLISIGLIASPSHEPGDIVNNEISNEVRNCIFKVLEQKVSKVEHLITLLISIVYHLNEILFVQENPVKLRQSFTDSSVTAWQKMIAVVKEIEAKNEDAVNRKQSGKNMFLVLFLHMGLQLFHNAPMAEEALVELHSCYEKTKSIHFKAEKKKKKKKPNSVDFEEDEPYWVEVIVDLLLSLLSHSSYLLRNMVGVIFPHLCYHLTPASVHQIVQVLDPHGKQPLSSTDTEGEDDSEDEANKEGSDNGSEVESGSDDEDDDFDDDSGNAPVDVHLKMAVHNALKKAGGGCSGSDEESVDMDKMTEDERNTLDAALSEAFKLLKHNQADQKRSNKKQSKDDETLMHFRVRVLDLIDMYLANQPALAVVLDIILPLFELLEFCIKDSHQKPLENRVRHCLKRLSDVKHFSNIVGVDQDLLSVVLRRLLQKGERAAAVYQNMGGPLIQCSTFLARTSHHLRQQETGSSLNKSTPVLDIYKEALTTFFQQRDSLLPLDVFKSVLAITWKGASKLAESILQFAFNPDVRPFRRHQALQLLRSFFSNVKLTDASPKKLRILEMMENKLSENTVEILEKIVSERPKKGTASSVKEKFIKELLCVLCAVWHSHKRCKEKDIAAAVDWEAVKGVMSRYWEVTSLATDTKIALKKLAVALQISLSKKSLITEQKKSNGQQIHMDESEYRDGGNDVKENGNVSHNSESENENDGEKSDSDTGDKGYESGNEEKEIVEEKTKKRKRPKSNNLKGKAILKKQSKEARLAAMADGLDDSLSFAGVNLFELQKLNDETESVVSAKKKKKHSDFPDDNDEFSDVPETPKKSKVKRKNISGTLPKRKKHKVSE